MPKAGYRKQTSHGQSHAGDGRGRYPDCCAFGDRCLFGGKIKMTGNEALEFQTKVIYNPHSERLFSFHVKCRREFGPPPGIFDKKETS
jgi:hypothetical protein